MELKVVTKRAPTNAELADLAFAFRIAKHVKSNTIVYAKDGATVGIGAGQMSRIDSARIAARKAEDAANEAGLSEPLTKGSVVASDAFFPFADGLLVGDRGRRHRRHPARRLGARRRSDQGRRRSRHCHGVHRHAAFSALETIRLNARASFASRPDRDHDQHIPATKNTTSTEMPTRWIPEIAVSDATSIGPTKLVTFPDSANRPKNSVICFSGG